MSRFRNYNLKIKALIIGSLVFVCGLSLLFAALTGDIEGLVTDKSGGVVTGATVTVRNVDTGATRTVNTDNGRFAFQQLALGTYEVKVEAQGFKPYAIRAVVKSAEKANLNVTLEVGEVTQVVEVTGEAAQVLDTVDAQLRLSIEEKRVKELPLIGRDPLIFATLSPGVTPVSANNPFLGSGSFNSNGGRGRGNNITIDNITASDISTTGGAGFSALSLDAIQEFKLITNNFSAEYGRNANAQVQIITKGGTNTLHGTVYEFLQNNALNARDYFDTTGKTPPFKRNQYGFTLGGPIRKDRTFAFGHYEGIQTRGQGGTRRAIVPTPSQAATITDPTSRAIFQQFQVPTDPSGSFSNTATNVSKVASFSVRIDHRLTDNDNLTGRFGWSETESISEGLTFVGTNLNNFGAKVVNPPRQVTLTESHVFSPQTVNEFRFSFGRTAPKFALNSTVPPGPRIAISGFDRFGHSDIIPQGRTQNTFQYLDTITRTSGAHSFKFGADINRIQVNDFFDANFRSTVLFPNFAAFAAGQPNLFTQNFGDSVRGDRITNSFFFAQDDYKVTSDLTLNLGVRLEVAGGVSEVNGKLSNLDLSKPGPIGGAGPGPLGSFVVGGSSFERNYNWEPRLGAAWNPGRGKWVFRAGYGIAHDFIFLNPIGNLRFLPPFITSVSSAGPFTGTNSWANLAAGTSQLQADGRASVGSFNPRFTNFGSFSPVDRKLKNPRVPQWNIGVQREISGDLFVKLSYVGSKGERLLKSRPINPIQPSLIVPAVSEADELARRNLFSSINAGAFVGPTGSSNRIDPRFNRVFLVESSASSIYHGMELEVVKKMSHGYMIQGAYTWSKAIDNGSDVLGVLVNDSSIQQNPFSNRDNRAASQFDIRHRFVMNHIYEIPWTKSLTGYSKYIFDGWSFNGIFQIQSGFPATIFAGSRRTIADESLIGNDSANNRANAVTGNFTPVPIGSAAAASIPDPCSRGVNTALSTSCTNTSGYPFTQPLIGNFGNMGRNVIKLHRLIDFDWVFIKNTKITESQTLQFRAEFFNTFNIPNFSRFSNILTSPSFGTYQGTDTDTRRIQFALKYLF